eukprot:CAMPEP_0204205394 /NCGR_PEP_ID=MMETSP0361-20130328/70301_1 /ASSEMBLY_ACC=CAM_ASM_000343 /TAXON_ID=268821 /ORGANISM="Scrippsiella Hangoei, Strain SHTV-5" /LENGTH=102 /DNA_ID=CAMNT_0051168639 /DNA_START=10 /DNA_END=318 /DNA_ORIENTATION=+
MRESIRSWRRAPPTGGSEPPNSRALAGGHANVSTTSSGNSPKRVPRSGVRKLGRTLLQHLLGAREARDLHPVDGLDAPLRHHAQGLGLAALVDVRDDDPRGG